jgi:hypothetical protein
LPFVFLLYVIWVVLFDYYLKLRFPVLPPFEDTYPLFAMSGFGIFSCLFVGFFWRLFLTIKRIS